VWQLDVLYTPLDQYFGTVSFGLEDWVIIATALVVGLPAYLAIVLATDAIFPSTRAPERLSSRYRHSVPRIRTSLEEHVGRTNQLLNASRIFSVFPVVGDDLEECPHVQTDDDDDREDVQEVK